MELKHAILGMLSITPLSGYDLNRAFVGSVAHFWHADQSQIYRTLDRLAADGAIKTKVIRQSGKPDRKVHSLTPAGRGELHRWLTSPLEEEKIKEPFIARVFFAGSLSRPEIERILDERERQAKEKLQLLKALGRPVDDLPSALRDATLRKGVLDAEAELTWIQETRGILERHSPQSPPEDSTPSSDPAEGA